MKRTRGLAWICLFAVLKAPLAPGLAGQTPNYYPGGVPAPAIWGIVVEKTNPPSRAGVSACWHAGVAGVYDPGQGYYSAQARTGQFAFRIYRNGVEQDAGQFNFNYSFADGDPGVFYAQLDKFANKVAMVGSFSPASYEYYVFSVLITPAAGYAHKGEITAAHGTIGFQFSPSADDWPGWLQTPDGGFHVSVPAPVNSPPHLSLDAVSPVIYNDQAVSGGGWAADEERGAPVSRVEVWLDGGHRGNAALGGERPDVRNAFGRADWRYSGFDFDIPAAGLSTGRHALEVRAYDNEGLSAAASREFTVGNRPPNITMSAGGVTVGGGQEAAVPAPNGSAVTLTVSASDSDGNYQRTRVWVMGGRTNHWEEIYDSSQTNGTLAYTLDSVGVYYFHSRSVDGAGAESGTAVINIDSQNRAPGPATLAAAKTEMLMGETVTLTATLADADGNMDRHGIWWDRGIPGSNWSHPQVDWGTPPDATGWSDISTQNLAPSNPGLSVITANWTPAGSGTYKFHCAGGDSAGAWGGGAEVIIIVSDIPPDTEAPSAPGGCPS